MVSENIKKLRIKKNLTLRGLAEKAKISKSTLSDIENSNTSPTVTTLTKIAEALEVPLDCLTRKSAKAVIEDKLEELDMSVETLSDKANVPVRFINNLDNIIPVGEDYEYVSRIALTLGLHPSILKSALARQEPPSYDSPITSAEDEFEPIGKENPFNAFTNVNINDFINIPILGSVRAGEPALAGDNIEGYNLVPKKSLCSDKEYFYLRVQGDSMNQEFTDGTLLLIEKTQWVENGTIAVVLIDGLEATVKRVIQNDNMVTLIPMSNNPEHIPHMYDVIKDKITIVGKVKQATRVY